jgi:hypothetical protein
MNRCKDCAFWKPHKKAPRGTYWVTWENVNLGHWPKPGHGTCLCEKFVDRSWGDDDLPPPENDELSYSDSEGYDAMFQTGPMFGCVHFEQRGERDG